MEIKGNYNSYDTRVDSSNINQTRANPVTRIAKKVVDAFYIEFSSRARQSKEFNDPNIKFPVFNPNVLQYNSNSSLTYKS